MNKQAERILKYAEMYCLHTNKNKNILEFIRWLDLSLSWQDEEYIYKLVNKNDLVIDLINLLKERGKQCE